MSYKVITIPRFDKELKKLAKKYPSLKKEYIELVQELKESPNQGTPIGGNCFKIRLAIASKGKGKSGGARIITYIVIEGKTVFLLSIYDKSEQSTITDKELQSILKFIP
jgi:mRNA-degrading endonuclease RelE of RelBE toxin-antitoxin system